jgi:hypothetical protein
MIFRDNIKVDDTSFTLPYVLDSFFMYHTKYGISYTTHSSILDIHYVTNR